jgi:hypothetical protein
MLDIQPFSAKITKSCACQIAENSKNNKVRIRFW